MKLYNCWMTKLDLKILAHSANTDNESVMDL